MPISHSAVCAYVTHVNPPLDQPIFVLNYFHVFNFFPPLKVTLSSLPEQEALSLQHRALGLLTDTYPSFVENLINIYQLHSLDPSVLRLHIVKLQGLGYYKEVIVSVFATDLQHILSVGRKLCLFNSVHGVRVKDADIF